MLFQCSARLTLIWLSGSALLPCQSVWAMVKLFEGGWRRGVACLCQAETRLRGCRTSVCSQTLTHKLALTFPLLYPSRLFIPCICSLSLSRHSSPSFSSLFLFPLSLSPSHPCRDKHTHITCTHFLLFLSEASLKELWLCGLEEIQTLRLFVGFFPEPLKHNTAMFMWSECDFKECQHHLN